MTIAIRTKKLEKYIVIYSLFSLLCLFQHLSFEMGALAVTVLLIAFGVFIPYSEMGVYLFSCLPFFNVMNFRLGTTSLYYVLTGIVVLRYLLHGTHYRLPKKIILLCVIIAATCYNLSATKEYIQWIIRVIPLVLLFREDLVQNHLKEIIDKFTLSLLFSSLWGWLMLIAGTSIYNKGYVYSEGTSVIRFAGLQGDSVVYGIQLALMISFCIVLLFKDPAHRKIRGIAIALMCFFGAMTYSKTFLICAMLELLFIYVYWSRGRKITPKILLLHTAAFVGVAAVTAGFICFVMKSNSIWATSLRARLLSSDTSSGRIDVWKYYLNWSASNWTSLFRGMGFSNYLTLRTFHSVSGYNYLISRAHNLYVETMVIFGTLETLIILCALIIWGVNRYRKEKNFLCFLPLLVLLITGMTTHGHFECNFYLNVLLTMSVAESGHMIAVGTADFTAADHLDGREAQANLSHVLPEEQKSSGLQGTRSCPAARSRSAATFR